MSNNSSSVVRNELSKYAQQIETLAREVQNKLASGSDPMTVANELARNSSTFIFTLGEMYALESSGRQVKVQTISNPNGTYRYYHNKRDALGRFIRA